MVTLDREAPMIEPGSIALVFESGVVRFDEEGVLHVHLAHSEADPHPLLIHELEAGLVVPPEEQALVLSGGEGPGAWRPRAELPETDELPVGLVLSFPAWDWVQVEMSGDLTVSLREVGAVPAWLRPGHVHRLARTGSRVALWSGSAPPPAVAPEERARLQDPMADWAEEHEAPPPGPSGRWVGGAQQAPRAGGCGPAAVFLGLGLGLAAGARAGQLPPEPDFGLRTQVFVRGSSELCFPSGLRVTVTRDTRQPLVSTTMVVDQGSSDDPEGLEGSAHLLEHLWFRARPDGETSVRRRLWALSAVSNAFTYPDVTVYISEAPRESLAELLRLDGHRLQDPLAGVEPSMLEAERAVVENELRWRTWSLNAFLSELPPELFPAGSPYASGRTATLESLADIGLEDLRTVAAAYRPDNVSLHITGDTDAKEVQRIIVGQWPEVLVWTPPASGAEDCRAFRAEAAPLAPPDEIPAALGDITLDVSEPLLTLTWRLPPAWTEQDPVMELVVQTVERVVRMADARRGAAGDDRGGSCEVVPLPELSLAHCTVPVDHRREAERIRAAVVTWLKGADIAAPPGFASAQDGGRYRVYSALEPARFAARARLMESVEALSGLDDELARRHALSTHYTGEPTWFQVTSEALARVDKAEAQALFEAWFTGDRVAALYVTPSDAPELAGDRVRGHHTPPAESAGEIPEGLAGRAQPPRLGELQTFQLDNGLRVVAADYGDVPVVHAQLRTPGGAWQETSPGLANLTWLSTYNDAPELSVPEWVAALSIGGSTWRDLLFDGWVSGGHAASGSLDGLLYLLRWQVDDRVIVVRSGWRDRLRHDLDDLMHEQLEHPEVWARRTRRQPLLGLSTRSSMWWERAWLGMRESMDNGMRGWLRGNLRPDRATLYLVGDLGQHDVEALVGEYFSTWRARGEPAAHAAPPEPGPLPEPRLTLFPEDRDLAKVAVACRVELQGEAGEAVLSAILGTRAFRSLREDPALAAYTPWKVVDDLPGAADLAEVGVTLPADRVDGALSAIESLLTEAPSEAELLSAQDAVLRSERLGAVSSRQVLGLLADRGGWQGDVAAAGAFGEEVLALDLDHLGRALSACEGQLQATVVGPEEAVVAELQAAGRAFETGSPTDQLRELKRRGG